MGTGTKAQIREELNAAMKAKDEHRKSTLRLALAAIKLVEVEKRAELGDADVHRILQKEVKLRREAIADAERAGRQDFIRDAEHEIAILESFLPAQLTEPEIRALAAEAIAETGAGSPSEMGAVMKLLMARLQGRAEGATVSRIVRELLAEI